MEGRQHRQPDHVGGVAVLAVPIHFNDFFSRGSPGNADWEGRKADSIGIGPGHLEWTIVDGGEKTRVPAKSRRLLRGHRDEARRGGYSALSGPLHKDEVGTWNIIKVSADELRSLLMP